jgi:putative peptidoglycan lipid II flippase
LIRRGAATFGFSIDAAARRRLPRIVMAALAMGGVLWFAAAFVWPLAASAHGFAQAAILGSLIAASVAIYGLLLALLGVVNRTDAVNVLKSSPPRDLRA